jgi:ubiquitin-like modifier-activating enzyme ATG7
LVELLVSLLQHPLGAAAGAPQTQTNTQNDHPLGVIPHQIRGFLSTFENVSVVGRSYKFCSACSRTVIDEYKKKGWNFVQKALNEVGYVEELSGLKEVCHPPLSIA